MSGVDPKRTSGGPCKDDPHTLGAEIGPVDKRALNATVAPGPFHPVLTRSITPHSVPVRAKAFISSDAIRETQRLDLYARFGRVDMARSRSAC